MGKVIDWEQRNDESARAFHAFVHYRDLPSHRRSIDAAFAEHRSQCLDQGQNRTGTTPSQWKKWSSAHAWVSRTADYDAHRDRLRRSAQEEALANAPERWAEYAQEMQERAFDALRKADLSSQPVRELRLLVTEGMRMEKDAFEFEVRQGLGDVDAGIRRFLEAVAPSEGQVAAMFADTEDDEAELALFSTEEDDDE